MKKIVLFFSIILFPFIASSQDINMQNGTFTTCTGTFFDSGGAASGYSNDENFVLTICPDTAGVGVELDFTSFTTESPNDVLTIYNGPDTSAPIIGDYTGTDSPGFVTTTTDNVSGCLTIEFVSNGFFTSSGWEAAISCGTPCQLITAVFDSSSPPPDGSGVIEADADEVITFNGSATFSGSGAGATYEWDFGDGTTGFGTTVMHSYPSLGTYPIGLEVTDIDGCISYNDINIEVQIGSNIPGNPFVDAGLDVDLDCASGETCTDITASFFDIGETNTYNVTPIVFNPPFPFSGLANSVNTSIDDAWNEPEPLPFALCFFGTQETQFQVGSNGVIRFDVDPGDTFNDWSFSDDIPNNIDEALAEVNVFTPGHDIDPSVTTTNEIAWEIIGTAPNRVLAVSYFEVPYFSCNELIATHMAVFYETTNIIDIYIKDKPVCPDWNGGNAVVGIQNDDGTVAFVPPGRNTSDSPWTTINEAWRFTPAGPSIVDFAWLDSTGAVISTDRTTNVCPSGTETYTARVIYTNCNGDTIELTDDVVVTSTSTFTVDLGPDIDTCDAPPIILDADGGIPGLGYVWFLDGVEIVGETGPTLTVTVSGTYSVEVSDNACTVMDEIIITFFDTPEVFIPEDIEICDDDGDGFAEFTLTDADAEITGGVAGLTVTYYLTLADADAGDISVALASPYTNITNPQIVFARVENLGGCYDTVALTLIVLPSPVLIDPIPDYVICDDPSGDGIEIFDLTTWDTQVVSDVTGLTITYHETAADADAGTLAITPADSYSNTSNPQTIYVRVENTDGCFIVGQFDLIVDPAPALVDPTPFLLCDDVPFDGFIEFDLTTKDNEINGGDATLIVTYHLTMADADSGVSPLMSPYTNITNPQTVYVRVEHPTSGCYGTTTLILEVLEAPDANDPTPLEVCDDDGDGFAEFTLTDADAEITGGAAGVTVSYHETLDDANNNVSPLTSPYTNIVAFNQTVYARVVNAAAGDCFTVVELDLIVNESPAIGDPSNLEVCDDNDDGFYTFDLTVNDADILNGLPASDYTIGYYEDAGFTSEISPADNYTNTSNPQTIYVLVTDVITGCTSETSFQLIVNLSPTINDPSAYELCDENNTGDGVEEFDLSTIDDEITGGDGSLQVTYHLTMADAEAGVSPLPTLYTNISNPQTIYVRVENTDTGCFSTTTLELIVLDTPIANEPLAYEICDDGSGTASFDLTSRDGEITGGASDVTVTYHISLIDAENGDNALSSPYTNTTNPELLYVRVESDATGCYSITTLELIVQASPSLTPPANVEECPDGNTGTLVNEFDLTEYNNQLGVDLAGFDISYHTTNEDAQDGTNAIINPETYNNVSNPETIYIRVTSSFGCYSVTSFTISVVQCEIIIPQGISPNGDGFNDSLQINGLELHPNFVLKIFDRRGILMYDANSSDANWEGRADEQNGELLPVGTYFYTLQLNDDSSNPFSDMQQLYSGWVYLNY